MHAMDLNIPASRRQPKNTNDRRKWRQLRPGGRQIALQTMRKKRRPSPVMHDRRVRPTDLSGPDVLQERIDFRAQHVGFVTQRFGSSEHFVRRRAGFRRSEKGPTFPPALLQLLIESS